MTDMQLLHQDDRGQIYQGEDCRIFYRKAGSVTGDNDRNSVELIYLLSGAIELTISDQVTHVTAPAQFEIPAHTYHKLLAQSDIILLVYEN